MAVQLGSAYGQIILDASGVQKGAQQAQGALLGLEKKGVASMLALGLSVGGIGIALKKGIGASLGLAKEFQSDMKGLELAAGDAEISLDDLRGAAIAVGADTRLLGVSASGAAAAMDGMYRSGLSNTLIFGDLPGYMRETAELGGVLRASVDLAAASQLDMVDAGELATAVLGMFGNELETDAEKAEFVNHALDNMVRAANASKAEVTDMRAALQNVGTEASRLGFSVEDTNNALALLSTYEIKGAEAGTALKSMLLNMNRQTDKVTDALAKLNVHLYDSEGRMRSLPDILGQLETAFADLTDEQRDHYMQTLAGTYGIKALSALLLQGTEGWYAMSDATARATSMQEQATAMAQTYAGRVEALEGNVETLSIMIGEKLLPVAEDWVEWAIVMVDEHGPKLVEVAGDIADAVGWISDAIQGQGTPLQNTAAQMAGLSFAAVGIGRAYQGLSPVMRPAIKEIGLLVGDLTTKFQLMREGAKLGEVAALGWSSSLVPVVASLAAIASWLVVINKWRNIQADTDEQAAEVASRWTEYLDRQVDTQSNAVGVAQAYISKASEIGRIWDENRLALSLLGRSEEEVQANTEELGQALLDSATSYEDYESAIKRVNDAMISEAQNSRQFFEIYDKRLIAVDQSTFEFRRNSEAMDRNFLATQRLMDMVAPLSYAEMEQARQAQRARQENERLAQALYDRVNAMERAGTVTRQEAAGMREALTNEFGGLTTEAEKLEAVQAGLAEASATAWETFRQNVYTGVQGALEAYRQGNAEMLAEQQRALGQMILNQAEAMYADPTSGITEAQMKSMRAAIHAQFGIVVDEAAVGRDLILQSFAGWQEGAVPIEELIQTILGIAPATEEAAGKQEEAIARADQRWVEYRDNVMVHGRDVALAAEEMATGVGLSAEGMKAALDGTVPSIVGVQTALLGIPTEHTFTLHLKSEGSLPDLPSGPDSQKQGSSAHFAGGTDFAPGGWAMVGELGPEMTYLPRGTQVLTAKETAAMLTDAATVARTLKAAGAAGGVAVSSRVPAGQERVGQTIQKIEMVNYVRDELDIEMLARRVGDYMLQRRRA